MNNMNNRLSKVTLVTIKEIQDDLDGVIFNVRTMPNGRQRTDYDDYSRIISNDLWGLSEYYGIDIRNYTDTILVDILGALQFQTDQVDVNRHEHDMVHAKSHQHLVDRLNDMGMHRGYVLNVNYSQRIYGHGDFVTITGIRLIDHCRKLKLILNQIASRNDPVMNK